MTDLLDQLEASLDQQLYYLSLISALAVPDIAAALESVDGRATGKKYAAWYETWGRPVARELWKTALPQDCREWLEMIEREPLRRNRKTHDHTLTGKVCYKYRCSMLHQGRAHLADSPYSRIIFFEPSDREGFHHYCVASESVLLIDVRLFCLEMIEAARTWLQQVEGTEPFETNRRRFIRRHPEGLAPYAGGGPVIG